MVVTETQIWGIKKPQTYDESLGYHRDLRGAIADLEELGFSVHIVNSYHKPVLVIQRRGSLGR